MAAREVKVGEWPDAPPGGAVHLPPEGALGLGCGCVFAVLGGGLALLLVVLFSLFFFRFRLGPEEHSVPRSDVDAAAASQAVARASTAALRRDQAQLDAATTAVRGTILGADGSTDVCRGTPSGAVQPLRGGRIVCTLTTQRTLGVGGDTARTLRSLDTALRKAGWHLGDRVGPAVPGAVPATLPPHSTPRTTLTYAGPAHELLTVDRLPRTPGTVPVFDDLSLLADGVRSRHPGPDRGVLERAADRHPALLTLHLADGYWSGDGPAH
jgi:hypothetical protein